MKGKKLDDLYGIDDECVSRIDLLLYPAKITSDDMKMICRIWNFFLSLLS